MYIANTLIDEKALPNGPLQRRQGERIKLYQPSNGTEGEGFYECWCAGCECDREHREFMENGCVILGRTMMHKIDDPEYPREWIYKNGKPTCTAFIPKGEEIHYKDDQTVDMFNG